MSNELTPGTIAHEAMQYLREHGETPQSTLAAGIGRNNKQLAAQLEAAELAGHLCRRFEYPYVLWSVGEDSGGAPDEDQRTTLSASARSAPSIFAYASERDAAPFSVSRSSDGRLSIERHGRLLLELTNAERELLLKGAA